MSLRRWRTVAVVAMLVAATAVAASPAHGQLRAITLTAPELAGGSRAPQAEPDGKPDDSPGATWEFKKRPRLRIGRDTHIDLTAKLQVDMRTFSPEPLEVPDSVEAPFQRLGVEGQVTRFVEFELEREFSESEWRAAFVNVRPFAAVQVQGGHFKVPFSRERLRGGSHLDFVERPVAVKVLAPGYDTGVMVHGRLLGRMLEYAAGGFEGRYDRDPLDTDIENPWVGDGLLWAGRVVVRPLRDGSMPGWLDRLEGGFNATRSEVDEGLNSWRGRAVYRQVYFEPVYVRGRRLRMGTDGAVGGPRFALQGEYLWGTDERLGQGLEDDDLPELRAEGWYVQGTFVVTRDRKRQIEDPERPLFRGGIGGLEVAARVERLGFASGDGSGEPPLRHRRAANVRGNTDSGLTFGVNWYPDRYVKVQVNAVRESFEDGQHTLLPGTRTFWAYVVRVQFAM